MKMSFVKQEELFNLLSWIIIISMAIGYSTMLYLSYQWVDDLFVQTWFICFGLVYATDFFVFEWIVIYYKRWYKLKYKSQKIEEQYK